MGARSNNLREVLEKKYRDELNIIARSLSISGYRALRKEQLVSAILQCDEHVVRKCLNATWWNRFHNHVYGAVTILACVLSIVFFVIPWMFSVEVPSRVIIESANPTDDLAVSKVRSITDQRTTIRPMGDTGVLSVFWEVTITNTGASDLSVIRYDIKEIQESGLINYTHMQQGIYYLDNLQLSSLQFPLVLPAGNSKALFLKIGILMDAGVYQLVKVKFAASGEVKLTAIRDFLRKEGLDFYGNAFKQLEPGAQSLPSISDLKEQLFGVTFETGRGAHIVEVMSWYKYGIFRDHLSSK